MLENEHRRMLLVVEDEAIVRLAAVTFLREYGFGVVDAGSGDQAMDILETSEIAFDLVFSDIQMPGRIDGCGLARWIRTEKPHIKVILTSGAVKDFQLTDDLSEIGPIEVKPYDHASIVDRIESELNATII